MVENIFVQLKLSAYSYKINILNIISNNNVDYVRYLLIVVVLKEIPQLQLLR